MKEKVLVIFPGALGDFVCFLPALRKLAEDRELDLLARTEFGELLPASVGTRSLERYEISRLFAPGADRDQKLRSFFSSYAMVWSWMGSRQPDFINHLSALSEGRARIFPFWPPDSGSHPTDYYLSCLGENYPKEIAPMVPLRPEALGWSRGFWRENQLEKKRVLVLTPGSGAKEKNWPEEFYKVVAEWWEKELGGKIVVVLGPVEEEKTNLVQFWNARLTARGLSLAQLATLLSQCDIYLGNDSGVTHLAAMLGVATVALFGPTDPVRWEPRGERVAVVTRSVECSPCIPPVMKACPHRKCLTALNPSDVIKVLQEISSDFANGDLAETAFLTRGGAEIKVQIEKTASGRGGFTSNEEERKCRTPLRLRCF